MGLMGRSSLKARRITTSLTILALVAQVLYGLIYASSAYAATTSIVSPDNMRGWQVTDMSGNGGSVSFVNTYGSIGSGSVQFNLSADNQAQSLHLAAYKGTKLADITTLSYDRLTTTEAATASLGLPVDKDLTDDRVALDSWLVHSPNGTAASGQWHHEDARGGLWWFSNPAAFNFMCSQLNPCSLDTIVTLYPNAGITMADDNLRFTVKSDNGDEPLVSNVDNFTFSDEVYNFEPITAPQLSSPAQGSVLSDSTFKASWQPVPMASMYIYEAYGDEAATQVRVNQTTTDTERAETLAAGTSLWWRVKTVDAQGNAGNWSELWKVAMATEPEVIEDEEEVVGGGIISGGGGGQTQELLTQLARLNEPFATPSATDAFVVPNVLSAIDAAGDTTDMARTSVTSSPAIDQAGTTAAVVPTENGWKFFGVLWYWWILPVILLGYAVARVATRSARSFLYSSDQI